MEERAWVGTEAMGEEERKAEGGQEDTGEFRLCK